MAKVITLKSPEPFDYGVNVKQSAGIRWPKWIDAFEQYVLASGVTDVKQKLAILLHVVGDDVKDIYESICDAREEYNAVKDKLNKYFKPMKNTDFQIYNFMKMHQEENEPVDDYVTRLRAASKFCEFDNAELEIRRQLIFWNKFICFERICF